MPNLFSTLMDHAVNRTVGVYQGLEPRRPHALVIPRFVTIGARFPSFLGEIEQHLNLQSLYHPLVLADERTWEIAGEGVFRELERAGLQPRKEWVRGNLYSQAKRVIHAMTRPPRLWSDEEKPWERRVYGPKLTGVIFAVGGGTVIDLGKLISFQLHIPCISVPTSLANDGIASPFSVIRPEGPGNITARANTPYGVVVDLDRVRPARPEDEPFFLTMMRSGIGDALSNLSATLDWQLAARYEKEKLDYLALLHSRSAAEVVLQRILAGVDLRDEDLILTLAAGLVSSGEAMSRVGSSRPASGFEHKLYHAWVNHLGYPTQATHGILVAVGTLLSLAAHEADWKGVREGMARIGLPVCWEDLLALGIHRPGLEDAIRVAAKVKPERYTIGEHLGADALIDAAERVFGPTAGR